MAAARRATRSTKLLEAVLDADPTKADAKLHLGLLYHYTNNLPAFVKAVGWVVWFIPRGNGQLAIPYIIEVVDHGGEYALAARFIWADIHSQGNGKSQQLAEVMFAHLVKQYPGNYRLDYNYLEVLNRLGRNEELLSVYEFALQAADDIPETGRLSLYISQIRALLTLGRSDVLPVGFSEKEFGDLPGWLREQVSPTKREIQQQRIVAAVSSTTNTHSEK